MYTALRALSPDFLDIMFTLIDDGFCTCQIVTNEAGQPVDYRFLQTNAYFERMTGLSDPVGKTALELVPNLESHWIETYGAVALDRVPRRFQQGSEAMGRWFDVFATPIEPHGHFAIVFRDTTPLRSAEAERAKALERAENLLLELNHRVMNSLGMISSIIALESRQHSDGDAARALERIRGRVQALADLYRSLNAAASVNAVSARDYIGAVVSGLRDSVATNAALTILSEIDEIDLCTRTAVPLGLIVNELVTNSLKYAFRPEEPGVISSGTARSRWRVEPRSPRQWPGHRRCARFRQRRGSTAGQGLHPPARRSGHHLQRLDRNPGRGALSQHARSGLSGGGIFPPIGHTRTAICDLTSRHGLTDRPRWRFWEKTRNR